ncbi:MAG: TonB-dependent receptor [Phycisphaerales bacterium JB058]
MKGHRYGVAVAAMLVAGLTASGGVNAQSEGIRRGSVIEEIVVTAQRREESLQDTAVSVSALSGEQLEQFNFQNIQAVAAQVPNFATGGLGGPEGPPFLNIRGISFIDFNNINEGSIALYIDDVYMGFQGAGSGQLFDVARVEVLRGPQGTLFGRNTTGGLAHFITRRPTDELEGYATLQYGEYEQMIFNGALSGPLSDGVRGRLAVKYTKNDGWQQDIFSGAKHGITDVWAARASLDWDISDTWLAEISIHHTNDDSTSPVHGMMGEFVPGSLTERCSLSEIRDWRCANRDGFVNTGDDPEDVVSDQDAWPNSRELTGGVVKLTGAYDWGEVVSVTAYEDYEQHFGFDSDVFDHTGHTHFPFPVGPDIGTDYQSTAEQFSQELRIGGEFEGTRWMTGVYYFTDEKTTSLSLQINRVATPSTDARVDTDSWALFAQVDAPITEVLTLAVGLRYTDESRDLVELLVPGQPAIEDSLNTSAVTGKLGLEWRPTDDALYYAQFSHGFKSGGYNPSGNPDQRGPVGEETIDAWELGLKHSYLDGSMRVNAAAFYYQFQDLQALAGTTDPDTSQLLVIYLNAGDPEVLGAEVELAWSITDNWELSLGLGVLDTEISAGPDVTFDGRPLDGKKLANAPDFNVNGMLRYYLDLSESGLVTLQTDFRYQDAVFFGPDNDPVESQDAYGIANIRVFWESVDRRYTAEAFVENLFDEAYTQHVFHQSASSTIFDAAFAVWGRPRTWGVKLGVTL